MRRQFLRCTPGRVSVWGEGLSASCFHYASSVKIKNVMCGKRFAAQQYGFEPHQPFVVGLRDAGSINRSHKILRCWAELFVMSVPLMVNCFVVLTVIVNDARARIEHEARSPPCVRGAIGWAACRPVTRGVPVPSGRTCPPCGAPGKAALR